MSIKPVWQEKIFQLANSQQTALKIAVKIIDGCMKVPLSSKKGIQY